MAASMFGQEFPPGTPAVLSADFGADLLSIDDAEGWLSSRGARCVGDWGAQGAAEFVQALTEADSN